jgi:hypothetical protein
MPPPVMYISCHRTGGDLQGCAQYMGPVGCVQQFIWGNLRVFVYYNYNDVMCMYLVAWVRPVLAGDLSGA